MAFQDVPFGGLAALLADERTGIEGAIDATNCVVDDGTIRGRNGYRNALSGALPVLYSQQQAAFATASTAGAWPVTITIPIPAGVYTGGSWQLSYTLAVSTSAQWAIRTQPTQTLHFFGAVRPAGTQAETLTLNASELSDINAAAGGSVTINLQISGNLAVATITNAVLRLSLTGNIPIKPQLLGRFRPTSAAARTIAVVSGTVISITDPSSETANDGSAVSLGSPFGSGAQIAGCQFGKYFYLGSDAAGVTWQRVKPDFTLEAITALPAMPQPAVSFGSLTVTLLDSLTSPAVALTNASAPLGGSVTDWYDVSFSGAGNAIWQMAANADWTAIKWLFVAISPQDANSGGGTYRIELATLAGAFESVGEIYDTPGGDGSTFAVFLPLTGLTSATRSAVRRLRLSNTSGSVCSISSFLAVPSAPAGGGSVVYYLTTKVAATGQESDLSPAVTVTYSNDGIIFPQFRAAHRTRGNLQDNGTRSVNPDSLGNFDLFNKSGGTAYPASTEFSKVATFSGTSPAGTYDTLCLYRVCSNGTRLVKEITQTPGAAYSITDDGGDAVLSHRLYYVGGQPPPCAAMAAVGGRLVSAGDPSNPPRISISNFAPFTQSNDPYPQFPGTPYNLDTDGWQFDIAPTAAEGVLALVNGDLALYLLTNEACYIMTNLRTNSTPYKIWQRGAIGRQAALWAENQLFWCAHDGVYTAANRQFSGELSMPIRRLFRDWFLPDASTVIGYQNRVLCVTCGQRQLRYAFTGNPGWTRHTLTDTMQFGAGWREPAGVIQNLWYLAANGKVYRWQRVATSDDGAAIPGWTFSTGYIVPAPKTRTRFGMLDVSGNTVTLNAYKDASTAGGPAAKSFPAGEHVFPLAPPEAYKWRFALAGDAVTQVRRLQIEMEATDGK